MTDDNEPDDDPPPDDFDYGERLDDGQFENHPTTDEGEFVRPIRMEYRHDDCGDVTVVSERIAESFARDPGQYSKTFCAGCGDYFPVGEFEWVEDGAEVGT